MNALKAILIVVLTALSVQVWGVDCSSTDITLYTQAEVDNFQVTYGDGEQCDGVIGSLSISGEDISDIDGLINLSGVGGDLWIDHNAVLTNLDGLSSLASVGGRFFIESNDALTNIDGLSSLGSVGGRLSIQSNATLTNIGALSSLASLGGGGDRS